VRGSLGGSGLGALDEEAGLRDEVFAESGEVRMLEKSARLKGGDDVAAEEVGAGFDWDRVALRAGEEDGLRFEKGEGFGDCCEGVFGKESGQGLDGSERWREVLFSFEEGIVVGDDVEVGGRWGDLGRD
jgi:hypothetical protein